MGRSARSPWVDQRVEGGHQLGERERLGQEPVGAGALRRGAIVDVAAALMTTMAPANPLLRRCRRTSMPLGCGIMTSTTEPRRAAVRRPPTGLDRPTRRSCRCSRPAPRSGCSRSCRLTWAAVTTGSCWPKMASRSGTGTSTGGGGRPVTPPGWNARFGATTCATPSPGADLGGLFGQGGAMGPRPRVGHRPRLTRTATCGPATRTASARRSMLCTLSGLRTQLRTAGPHR